MRFFEDLNITFKFAFQFLDYTIEMLQNVSNIFLNSGARVPKQNYKANYERH